MTGEAEAESVETDGHAMRKMEPQKIDQQPADDADANANGNEWVYLPCILTAQHFLFSCVPVKLCYLIDTCDSLHTYNL